MNHTPAEHDKKECLGSKEVEFPSLIVHFYLSDHVSFEIFGTD